MGRKAAVLMYNETHYKNFTVNKALSLVGEDKATTIIDGGGADVE